MSLPLSQAIEMYTFQSGRAPLVFEAQQTGLSMIDWAEANLATLKRVLDKVGVVLLRGFRLGSPQHFETLIKRTMGEPIQYTYASTPRTKVMSNIYTSTEYPAHRTIPLHNEMAYTSQWPRYVFFYCHTPAPFGGQTPIADSRRVYQNISEATRAAFVERQLCYVRNYDGQLDLSWQQAFSTQSVAEVEARCRERKMEWEWVTANHLRTREVCQAAMQHPRTQEWVWFNQAHLFHVSALESDIRELLLANGEINLPRNVYFGDGSAIPQTMLAEVRDVLDQEQITFDWQQGDVMLIDNLLSAHGRLPYEGNRKILVGMTA